MGKSATANIFSTYGVPVFDADNCVHQLIGFNGKKFIKEGVISIDTLTIVKLQNP